jgi:3-deoxy-D-manno-octulosonic-acid transferase
MGVSAAALQGVRRAAGWRGEELNERLGCYGEDVLERLGRRWSIWLHAASVGELQGVRALIGPLRERFPQAAIVVSALTRTGRAAAQTLPGVDAGVFFPFDAPSVVRRALSTLRPRLFLFTETELWPSMLRECARRGVPAILVSGRLSERSMRRYVWLRSMMARTLADVTLCAQSEADARRLVTIGAAPERVSVAGNLKAEAPVDEAARRRVARVLTTLDRGNRELLVGASTHRGEEAAMLSAFDRVAERWPALRLVLAPRHPERFAEVAELLERSSRRWISFGDLERAEQPLAAERILLLDRMGVLRGCFPYARLVFVGGTLAPIGGHSLLEPAVEGCALIFGPHTEHVAQLAQTLLDRGGARRVTDAAALADLVETLGTDATAVARVGALAAGAVAAEQGALARHLDIVLPHLAAMTGEERGQGPVRSGDAGTGASAAGAGDGV